MDALSAMLDGPRTRGAYVLRCLLAAPWSIRVGDEAPLALVAMVRGQTWLTLDGDEPVALRAGDVALIKGPEHYTLSDPPGHAPDVFVGTDEVCRDADGGSLEDQMLLGVRTCGNALDGETAFIVACYDLRGQVTPRLLGTLPPFVRIPATTDDALMRVLHAEVDRDAVGQQVILDRLVDLVLVQALRAWFADPASQAPRWWQATSDPVVGPAVRALQANPASPWTIDRLARSVGVSRATLARRFTELVGEPPMSYLTSWRLTLAADLLRSGTETLPALARQLGYASGFSFSSAFKRRYGVSPQTFRADTSAPSTEARATPPPPR
ncbi:AraC family transcriptional regulator [Ruania halotolerans]|uniref:AraC family transcriptional regulator n=1 Tax=Ruania halotolerans TaxID=2897773 RepID=UPI001E36F561|nr:AraC family transcriptional regulator [Ruania halotolerans]UFU05953.1 AraC family transcriptional regulator [Ruania halotolerans]